MQSRAGSGLSRSWVVIAGAVIGALTLLFLMGLVVMGVAGYEVPCGSRYLVSIVLSFGAAMSAAFLGGNAAARGHLPIPGLQGSPLVMSASGGIAVLVLMLVLSANLFEAGACGNGLAISCPPGQQAYAVDKLRFGFCYPREGWEVDSGPIGINAADIYVRRSENRDIGVHFHVSLIPAGWAGRPGKYTEQVARTWRQLDPNLTINKEFIGGRDAYTFRLKVKDRQERSRPTEVTHIYLDRERLLEVIMTWFDDSASSLVDDMQKMRSSLEFSRI